MPPLLPFAQLLQIPLAKPIQEMLTTIQKVPLVARVITVCVGLGMILILLEMPSNRLSSLLSNLLNSRSQLDELGPAPPPLT